MNIPVNVENIAIPINVELVQALLRDDYHVVVESRFGILFEGASLQIPKHLLEREVFWVAPECTENGKYVTVIIRVEEEV